MKGLFTKLWTGFRESRVGNDRILALLLCLKVQERTVAEGQCQPTGRGLSSTNTQPGSEGVKAISTCDGQFYTSPCLGRSTQLLVKQQSPCCYEGIF